MRGSSALTGRGEGPAVLLARHLPLLRFDSAERYFLDAVEIWTDHPGAVLHRSGGPPVRVPGVSFLGAERYADGVPTSAEDSLGLETADPVRTYAEAVARHPQWRDRAYGHTAQGGDGRLWLAYWFFSFRNDFRLWPSRVGAGIHEGDWEMIQIRLDERGRHPDLLVAAQHARTLARPWAQLERVGTRPVLYPGRGSHACYLTRGVHWTGAWLEPADGDGRAVDPTLTVIGPAAEPATAWAHWPGRWGGTRPRAGWLKRTGIDAISPHGPGHQRQWRDPTRLLAS